MLYIKEIQIQNRNNDDKFPYNLPLFKNGLNIKFNKSITFLVGDNGTGKSTLLESIASIIGFNSLGGSSDHHYDNEAISDNLKLADNIKIIWNLKTNKGFFFLAESYFTFIKYIDDLAKDNGDYAFLPYGGKSLQKQSHGESFLSLFKNRFNNGVFILDEPEAALSPEKQLTLISIIYELTQHFDCQFIIATHSPILITCPDSEVYEIRDDKIMKVYYSETKQFEFYKDFLNAPERFLKYLS